MIFQLIAIIIILYSFKNYKKAFLWFMLYKVFLNTNINFLSIPGIPILSVDDAMIMAFIALYYLKKEKKVTSIYMKGQGKFPFKLPFTLITISWTVSTVFAVSGFGTAVSAYMKNILEYIVMTFLMWRLINTKEDLQFLIRGFTFAFLICGLYELYEVATQSNPLADYESTLVTDASRAVDFGNYEGDEQRGFRAKSVFSHPIGAGINYALYIIITLFFLMRTKLKFKINRVIILGTCLLSLACIIMTKSRGPYLFMLIGAMAFINMKSRKFYRYAIILALALIIILPYFSDQLDIFTSIFSSQAQEKVGGSDADMRFQQLACAMALMAMSPVYGLGFKYLNEIQNAYTWGLLGGESIWFSVIPQFGIIGIIAYVFMVYWTIIKLPMKYKSFPIFFISLAYWAVNTSTSVPGMQFYLYYLILVLIIKNQLGVFVRTEIKVKPSLSKR